MKIDHLMRRAKYIICMILMVHAVSLAGQSRSDLREMFASAEGDLLYEDYPEALPKYLSLLQIFPENYNLYYRVGQCYLNTPGEKDKAIPWLETAAQNVNPEHHPGKLRETGAPYDALYLLANAYRIGNNFDKALETYDLFLRDADTEKYDTALVRFQMETCNNARRMMRKPVYVVDKNLGSPVNERFSEYNPVISADEKTLLFTRELQFYDAIFWSRKIDGRWTEPVNLTPQLGVDQDYYTSSLTPDGKTLLMYRVDTWDGNIYVSHLQGETWSKVEKLNGNVNTKFWESHATMSSDGKKLYFTSNRRESIGGLDIFVSARDSTGNWGPAKNMGPGINTVYDEQTPFLANNDSSLFFSSRGHFNIGGYDIFRSDLGKNGVWSTPVNLGYPLNTTDDNLFFNPVGKGDRGYYGKFADDGSGMMDLYSCDIYTELNPRNFIITGKARVNNLLDEFLQPVKITAVNTNDSGRQISTLTNPLTGLYSFGLPQGAYDISFDSDDALSVSRTIDLLPGRSGDTVKFQPVTLSETDFAAYFRLLSDTLLKVSSPDPVGIDLIAEEQSLLDVEILSADSVITSEQYRITDSTFTFTFNPEKGDSRVSLTLTDRFGNDTGAVVTVRRRDVPARTSKFRNSETPVRPAVSASAADETGSATSAKESGHGDNGKGSGGTGSGGGDRTRPKDSPETADNAPATSQSGGAAATEADGAATTEFGRAGDSAQSGDSGQPEDTGLTGDTEGKGKCRYWWLLIVAGLLLFFLLWRRNRKKNDEDER